MNSDIELLRKLETDENFEEKIAKAKRIAKTFNCDDNEIDYYKYQIYINDLNGIKFSYLSYLERFSNPLYYSILCQAYEKKYLIKVKKNYSKFAKKEEAKSKKM